jgi:processing peptidase subunit alpha
MIKNTAQVLGKSARSVHISAAPPRQPSILQNIFGRSSFPITPLNVPFAAAPTGHATEFVKEKPAQLTTLSNGMRVVSLDTNNPSVSFGVHVAAGSRYEDASNHGISTFLEQHAFKSTSNRTAFRYTREMQKLGVSVGVTSTRDSTSYCADVLYDHVPHALGGIADVLANAEFLRHELIETRERYVDIHEGKAGEVTEVMHAAAFCNNTYGNPMYASKAQLEGFTTEALVHHTERFWTADRLVISAVGMEHKALVDMAGEMFSIMPTKAEVVKASPVYTGGDLRIPSEGGMTNFSMGFEAPSWTSPDVVPMLVLQTMMGGGGAFSAGGPGKGMFTRIYRNVLNGNPWVIHSRCDVHTYDDAGIFTISGTCQGHDAPSLANLLVNETKAMTKLVSDTELSRAKNMLKSSILLALESRQIKQQDMAQSVATYGDAHPVASWIAKIDAIKGSDLQRVAAKMLASPLTTAVTGDVTHVPSYQTLQSAFSA